MSAIPDVIDGLITAWTAADVTLTIETTAAPLQVVDGPVWDTNADFVAVGWDRSGQPGVTGDGVTSDLRGDTEAETFDVSCLMAVWYGADRNLSAVRRAQFVALRQLRAALDAITVGPDAVADTAEITTRELAVTQLEGGVASDLRFDVHVTAFGA